LIGGQWLTEGVVRERMDPCDPSRVVARYHDGSPALVKRAVDAARAASPAWRTLPYQTRCRLVREAKAKFVDGQALLGGIASAETGKIRVESLAEMAEAVDLIEYYASEIERNDGYVFKLKPGSDESRTDILRPYGIFGIISPFNFPVALAVNMASAALLAGNTVVVKPSDKTPRSTTEAMALIAAALPAGVFNIVQGGPDIGEALVKSDIDGIAFTGSAQVGWGIIKALQSGARKKPVLAEMGGQNPAVVSSTADLDAASAGIIRSAFGLSGQKCSSCRRVVVERPAADALKAKLRKAAEALKVGDPSDPSSNLGPVIDSAIAERVDAAVSRARKDGSVLTGGRLEGTPGHYFRPIIVTDLPLGHPLTRDELFAPFLTVVVVDDFDQAMQEANAVEYGLSAGVYTKDEKQKQQFLDGIEAGVVYVNRPAGATTGAWPGAQPFCGWKSSGSTGKGGLGPWYLPGFMREQSRTIVERV
jgi:1-pyrroline-5-carboxylate dehydrogenase